MNKQLALAIKLNDEATFTDFNWEGNLLLKQQLLQLLKHPEERILYLWGTPGSGKSHLLQAACQEVSTRQSAIYLPLRLLKEWGPQTLDGLEEQQLICIDDVDIISGNNEWEEGLFHLYNKIRDNSEHILIISGNQTPNNLEIKLPDLRSRIGWGLVIQVHELSDEEKIKTLSLHATKRGFHLPAGVGQLLLTRCSRNMHDLHQLLNQLDDASLAAQRKITIPFAKEILDI